MKEGKFILSLWGVLCFFLLIVNFSFVSANDVMTVEVDIYSFPEVVQIDVPDFIDIGNVTVGFETKPTSEDKIYIKNTGTFNVSVQPSLLNFADGILQNLYFTKRLSGENFNYSKIGQFKVEIPWSGKLNVVEEDYIYMKLDLRNMSNIDEDLIDYRGDVVFIATEA